MLISLIWCLVLLAFGSYLIYSAWKSSQKAECWKVMRLNVIGDWEYLFHVSSYSEGVLEVDKLRKLDGHNHGTYSVCRC